ncbi:hypothetical protein J7L06_08010 [Candidatus Bathyarchaeota archaeon]|nr:hypothetical protein [Candidatus Bathyarchaeota archaeon]
MWSFIQGHKAFLNARITCEKFFNKLEIKSLPPSVEYNLMEGGGRGGAAGQA